MGGWAGGQHDSQRQQRPQTSTIHSDRFHTALHQSQSC
nr:MAG TPA: hypothetical protein [Caudoviricetes sp.]